MKITVLTMPWLFKLPVIRQWALIVIGYHFIVRTHDVPRPVKLRIIAYGALMDRWSVPGFYVLRLVRPRLFKTVYAEEIFLAGGVKL